MPRANPDQIIAHVDLLRAVDRLLVDAEDVRRKRDSLTRLFAGDGASADDARPEDSRTGEEAGK